MPKTPKLHVDLADPDDIRAKVPQVADIVAAKQQAAVHAQEELETWTSLLARLRALAGLVVRIDGPDGPTDSEAMAIAEEAVVRVVEEKERPIMPIGVKRILKAEGHEVGGLDGVLAVLSSAADAGRLQQLAPRVFAPNSLDPSLFDDIPAMQAVPEAHFGLDGPFPTSKAEAAIRAMASDPSRAWSTPELGDFMVRLGWMTNSESDIASLASTLSRLVSEQKIFRPQRGRYQLAPPSEERN